MATNVRSVSTNTNTVGLSGVFKSLMPSVRTSSNTFSTKKRRYFAVILAIVLAVALGAARAFGASGQSNSQNEQQAASQSGSGQATGDTASDGQQSPGDNDKSEGKASNANSSSITVNGQSVAVPQNGTYDTTVEVPGGQVHISGETSQSNSTGGSVSNNSSTNIRINSR